jgi:hypothetical protein
MQFDLRIKPVNRHFLRFNSEEIAISRIDTTRGQDILNHFFLEPCPQGVKSDYFIL